MSAMTAGTFHLAFTEEHWHNRIRTWPMARILIALLLILVLAPGAEAAKRVGLVIGNDLYPNVPQDRQLKKAINDAKAMRDTLEHDLGFTVLYGEIADYRRMNALITELETATEAGDIVFVYFSGHGVSLGAENYLMPSDIPKPVVGEEARLAGNSFGADALTRRLQKKGARAIFAVLDACRDNPFGIEGGKAAGRPSCLRACRRSTPPRASSCCSQPASVKSRSTDWRTTTPTPTPSSPARSSRC